MCCYVLTRKEVEEDDDDVEYSSCWVAGSRAVSATERRECEKKRERNDSGPLSLTLHTLTLRLDPGLRVDRVGVGDFAVAAGRGVNKCVVEECCCTISGTQHVVIVNVAAGVEVEFDVELKLKLNANLEMLTLSGPK